MDEKEFRKGFQGVMGYTDDEIEIFKSDPKHNRTAVSFTCRSVSLNRGYNFKEVSASTKEEGI